MTARKFTPSLLSESEALCNILQVEVEGERAEVKTQCFLLAHLVPSSPMPFQAPGGGFCQAPGAGSEGLFLVCLH